MSASDAARRGAATARPADETAGRVDAEVSVAGADRRQKDWQVLLLVP
jgi:hypothetical protein